VTTTAQLEPELVDAPAGDPAAWLAGHWDALRAEVTRHGALLVRGLALGSVAEALRLYRAMPAALLTEREAFAPREHYAEDVYSSSKWPADQPMCAHHELSYATRFPGLLAFGCLRAPESGGHTGLADARAVLRALPADLVERFERDGWLLYRSYNGEVGATLTEAFGTEDRDAVDAYCRANAIDTDWRPDGTLRTRQHRPAVRTHPVTGERCWFNQIAFLNEHTMAAEVREYLTELYGPDALPFTTAFGDGEPIGPDVVDTVNAVYEAHTTAHHWQPADLLLVDNIATAHSTTPYRGAREIVVGLAEPVHATR
jgi:alpha-ketoglutarate-dependent taurine dioxygenase